MESKAACRDNIFIERCWRTVKYEAVYLRAYETVSDARRHVEHYMTAFAW